MISVEVAAMAAELERGGLTADQARRMAGVFRAIARDVAMLEAVVVPAAARAVVEAGGRVVLLAAWRDAGRA